MAKLQIGDTVPTACTQVDALPLRPLKKDTDNDSSIQYLIPTPESHLHLTPLASLESSDPLTGMQKTFNDNGLKVCNTIASEHPTPWGKQHTPFHLFVGGCRPVTVDIDWVSHRLDFGDLQGLVQKLPDRDFPGLDPPNFFGFPFSFRDDRLVDDADNLPSLLAIVVSKWFDEKSVDGDPDGLDEPIHETVNLPMLTDDNDFVTFQVAVHRSFHVKNDPVVQTNDAELKAFQNVRTLTCEEVNDILGTNETAEESDTWTVLGTNAGIALDSTGADPVLAPDGFAYIINVVYKYSIT